MGQKKKYMQLYDEMVKLIQTGKLAPGDRLPTEQELSHTFAVSRQTVRQALGKMKEAGLVSSLQGSGSFVSEKACAMRRTCRIAVITTYISTYIFPSILRGIEDVATSNGYSILLKATNNSIAKERDILSGLSAQDVDGLIVEGTKTALPNPNLPFYRTFASSGLPLAFFNGYYPDLLASPTPNIRYVVMDDRQGGYELTHELLAAGHRRIGAIFKSDDIQGVHRFSGYMQALTENDVPIRDEHILWFNTETKHTIAGQPGFSALLQNCTALVCYNDEIAAQVLAALQDAHTSSVRALRSFDGMLPAPQPCADLRSLPHAREQLGALVAQKLLRMIAGAGEYNAVMPWK